MSKPTLPAIILGRKLLQLRLDAGLTQAQAAKRSRFSDSKLSDIENGKGRIRLFDVAGLCRIYEAPAELTQQLERMSDEVDSPSWWEPYSTYMLRDFAMLLELEGICAELDAHEPQLIPGLLQTERYALTVNGAVGSLTDEEVQRAAELRLLRQQRFWSRDPLPRVRIVLGAATLNLSDVDDDQRKRLIEADEHNGVDIRILPDATPHPSMRGGYQVITSGIREIDDCLYIESMAGARYETNVSVLSGSREAFDRTFALAIPAKEYLNGTR